MRDLARGGVYVVVFLIYAVVSHIFTPCLKGVGNLGLPGILAGVIFGLINGLWKSRIAFFGLNLILLHIATESVNQHVEKGEDLSAVVLFLCILASPWIGVKLGRRLRASLDEQKPCFRNDNPTESSEHTRRT